jgi:outer membrane cobalamin receptor
MLLNSIKPLWLVIFALSVQQLFSQSYSVSGRVQEDVTKQNIAYATVAIYNKTNNTLLTGIITDDEGKFHIELSKGGNYYVKINILGYGEHVIDDINLNQNTPELDLGAVLIKQEHTNLDEIVVHAEGASIEYKVDRKVIDVEKLGVSNNMPLSEALQILPAVETDADGNVSLRGSRNFQVLIDGKPTVLNGSEALQQFTSAQIEKIEVITNPSAKYEANNTSGIINLILKKGEGQGVSGMFSFGRADGIGQYQPYNINSILSFSKTKFRITANFNADKRIFGVNWAREQTRDEGPDVNRFSRNKVPYIRNRAALDFDYFISKNHTITLAGRIMINDFDFDIKTENDFIDSDDVSFLSKTSGASNRHTYAYTLQDQIKFKKEGEVLTTLFSYFKQSRDEPRVFLQYETLEEEDLTRKSIFETLSDHDQFQFKTDYTKPLKGEARLELGANIQVISRESKIRQEFFIPNTTTNNDLFYFKNGTYAGYATFKNSIKNINYQIGLRAEYYSRLIEQKSTSIEYDFNKLNLFPSINLSKKLDDKNEIKLSYSKRIRRPTMPELQPYLDWGDQFFSYSGNPNLIPELINSTELSFIKRLKGVSISTDVYFRDASNKITRGLRLNPETETIERSPVNINSSKVLGVESSVNFKPVSWWRLIASGTYFRDQIKGALFEEDINQSYNGWRIRLSNSIDLPSSIKIMVNGYYNSKVLYALGEVGERYWVNATLSTTFYKKQGTISLNFRDIFGSRREDRISRGVGFTNTLRRKLPSRKMIGLSVSYRFNSYKRKQNRFDFED